MCLLLRPDDVRMGNSAKIHPENLYKLVHAAMPPDTRTMQGICAQGFSDAMAYLEFSDEMIFEAGDWVLPLEMAEVFEEIIKLESSIKDDNWEEVLSEVLKVGTFL